ncbi:unnamed protein product [Durusdinium trenchii]|uniref:EF-hand domain-containing protein n=1 Tax=Durusdinium trenchii TaxID=1381693 RepID=A0ABP0PQH4_9DINO
MVRCEARGGRLCLLLAAAAVGLTLLQLGLKRHSELNLRVDWLMPAMPSFVVQHLEALGNRQSPPESQVSPNRPDADAAGAAPTPMRSSAGTSTSASTSAATASATSTSTSASSAARGETTWTSTGGGLPAPPEGLRVASGAPAASPFRVQDHEPSSQEFAPVFVEEQLMARKDFRIFELQTFNLTVDDPEKAVFYLVCCGPLARILSLPPRSPERPYLCYDCDAILGFNQLAADECLKGARCPAELLSLLARRDFMFSSTDLRWWNVKNDSALLMPGVTHAHPKPTPEFLKKVKVTPASPPSYFLTFQGTRNVGMEGSSFVRLNLEAMLNCSKKPPKGMRGPKGEWYPLPEKNYTPPEDVFIAIGPEGLWKERRPYWQLFDSAYSLVLHGHGRWSYRLMEALNGEAIPVVMAEGWTLPFDELIDWEQIAVQRPEALGSDPAALLASLEPRKEVIAQTRQNVKEVYQKLLETQEARLTSLLRSAALWKRQWQEKELSSLRMLVEEMQKRGQKESLGVSLGQITDYYKELVKGNDGAAVSREEFCEWILKGGGIAETVFKALMKETSDVLATSVREVFARFDVSGDGKLDMRELWRVFKSLDGRLRLRDLAALSQELDTGGDGTVSVREFLQWLRHGSERASALARVIVKETGKAREVRIRNAFQKYDATGDGVLDIEELATTLKVLGSFSSDEIKHVRADLDRSGDGSVSFDEFSTWIKCGKGRREVLKAKAILAPSDGDGMEAVFYNFCGPGHADMNGMNFTRFCKDCGLLDGPMDSVMADLIFSDTRVKDHAARTIDPLQFEFALEILAEKKHLKLAELRAKVLLQGAPKKLMAHHEDHHPEGKQRRNSFSGLDETQLRSGYKKPPRCSSQKRIAALLKRFAPVVVPRGGRRWG